MKDQSDSIVLQEKMPEGQEAQAGQRQPAVRPVEGPWLFCDDAYGAQMAVRRRLLETCEAEVYAQTPDGLRAARGFLALMLEDLPDGFIVEDGAVICPDGHRVTLEWDAPLWSVGNILQQDVCIMEKREVEHVLTGAVLCFPASWTLAQKIGKPLVRIHKPVADYEDTLAARVQRLFDGVQEGRPLWRANALRYDNPTLFQPRDEGDPRPVGQKDSPYLRSERQTILRLPQPDAAAFVIHTTIVKVA